MDNFQHISFERTLELILHPNIHPIMEHKNRPPPSYYFKQMSTKIPATVLFL